MKSFKVWIYLCNIVGGLVLLALGLLTPYFFYIPKASLAAVIICAVVFIFEYEELIRIWQTNSEFLAL